MFAKKKSNGSDVETRARAKTQQAGVVCTREDPLVAKIKKRLARTWRCKY